MYRYQWNLASNILTLVRATYCRQKNNAQEQNGWMPNRPSCIVSTAFSSFLILFYVPLSRPASPILSVYPSHRPLVTLTLENLKILSNFYVEKNVCLCLEFKLLLSGWVRCGNEISLVKWIKYLTSSKYLDTYHKHQNISAAFLKY